MRLSSGREKRFLVSSYSIRVPTRSASKLKNAVLSATRSACCMLWVTITIVYLILQLADHTSIDAVAIGSGVDAWLVEQHDIRLYCDRVSDAQSLLLPAGEPESALLEAAVTSSHNAALRSVFPTRSVKPLAHTEDPARSPGDVVVDLIWGTDWAFLEHDPDPTPNSSTRLAFAP